MHIFRSVARYSVYNKKPVLCCPGPVRLHRSVKRALANTHVCHRDNAFEKLMNETTSNLHRIANTDATSHNIVFVTGSGTSSNETALIALGKLGPILVITNGEFGERLYKLATLHHAEVDLLAYEWTKKIRLQDVGQQLASKAYAGVVLVHHETSTGMLNPVQKIAALAKLHGVFCYVDAVSSLGAEDFLAKDWGIDVFVSSSGKALNAVPGIGVIGVSHALNEKLQHVKKTVQYLDLPTYIHYAKTLQQTPNTPSVHALTALKASTDLMLKKGMAAHHATIQKRADATRAYLRKLGLSYHDYGKGATSRVITCVKKDVRFTVSDLLAHMRSEGVVLYGGKGSLEHTIFQIGHIGELSRYAMHYVHASLRQYMQSKKIAEQGTVQSLFARREQEMQDGLKA